jgi:membrane-bound lytic murein transglycosylase F
MKRNAYFWYEFGAVILFIAVIFFIRNSRQKISDLPEILDSGRLSVLTDSSSIGFCKTAGTVSGFQYEIVKAFADTMGLELVISEQNDFKYCIDGLKSADYNLIANFTPITTEWNKEILFTNSLLSSRQVLVQRYTNDSLKLKHVNRHADLANDSIYIPLNSPFKLRLNHLSDEIASPITIIEVKNKSSEQMVKLVASGKIKYTICDELFAKKLKLQYPNLDVSLPVGFNQELAWAVHPKSRKLLAELNDFLSDFIGSSAYWDIYNKYY